VFIGPRRLPLYRMLENLSFGVASAWRAAWEERPDVVLLETWPLAATQLSMWQARLRKTPLLYYVKDLYPEALETTGLIAKGGIFARVMRAWDRHLCLSSKKVIAISNSMREILVESRGLPPDLVTVIPDWIDEDEFRQCARDNTWRRAMQLPMETFVALFAGTMGIVSGADILVEAASRLQSQPDIQLLCIGQGVLKERMVLDAKARGLKNIRFEPFQSRERVPEMQAASDVCLLTMRKDSSNASVPSKLISYLAAARPVICAAPPDNDVARIVRNAGAGTIVPAGDADALAGAIVDMRNHPEDAARQGLNARRYFEEHLAFRHRHDQFLEVLSSAALAESPGSCAERVSGAGPSNLSAQVERAGTSLRR
jgi:colanic acid biosynthesis glycosyl transferase WcaI